MSYARWSEGDVYVFGTGDGFTCMACPMMPTKEFNGPIGKITMHTDFDCKTEEEMLRHLEQHMTNGDSVPQRALDRLQEEIDEENKT